MVLYKCFYCSKEIEVNAMRKKVRCPYCGSKLLYKLRLSTTKVKAR
ncbi:MAG: DNA-directed RNA polymerase subunit P [Nanoarchaeota archaeon]|nr:DNA-directed RNA polymerase subunit P [Nanoarchaeota archaeon]